MRPITNVTDSQTENDPEQQAAELGDLPRQRRGEIHGFGDERGDAARLRRVADAPHDAFALAGGDVGAGEGEILPIRKQRVGGKFFDVFGNRHGFAGQRGFVHL